MSIWQITLLIGAAFAALVSFKMPRAWVWIGAAAASFGISTWAARAGLPYPETITALSDASICFAIYFYGRERWERWLFLLFQGSLLTSILYLAGVIGPHWAYIAFLEAINWAALLVISGTAILNWIGDALGDRYRPLRHLRGANAALHKQVYTPFRGQ